MTHKGNTSIIIQMKVFDGQITLWNGGSLPPGYTVENLSSRTIQRDLTRLKDLNVIKHEGPDNGGYWVVLMDLKV